VAFTLQHNLYPLKVPPQPICWNPAASILTTLSSMDNLSHNSSFSVRWNGNDEQFTIYMRDLNAKKSPRDRPLLRIHRPNWILRSVSTIVFLRSAYFGMARLFPCHGPDCCPSIQPCIQEVWVFGDIHYFQQAPNLFRESKFSCLGTLPCEGLAINASKSAPKLSLPGIVGHMIGRRMMILRT
jgi:hypothetical protein